MDDSNDPHPASNQTDDERPGRQQTPLGEDAVFEALAHERRRYLLYALLDDDELSLERLARKVTEWEEDTAQRDMNETDVDRVYASLYHAHVPKLVDLGIVEFDRRTEQLARGTSAEPVLEVLELTGASDAVQLERHARDPEND